MAKRCADETLYYIVTDHLGTPKELISEDGKHTAWASQQDTWGKFTGDIANPDKQVQQAANQPIYETDCPIRFLGQWADEESGLCYNRFRFYDPEAGQYISPDPISLEGGLAPQAYVHNPNGWVDPLGLAGCSTKKPQSWSTACKQFWENLATKEAANPSGWFSKRNLAEMAAGRAPKIRVQMRKRSGPNAGQIVTRDTPLELHHKSLPQRMQSGKQHEPWNLEIVNRWAHEAMDEYRHAGWDLLKIVNGPNSW